MLACKTCGSHLTAQAKFCHSCGNAVTDGILNETSTKAPHFEHGAKEVSGARKHVTVLFADIARSTQIISEIDPEDAHAFFNETMSALSKSVENTGGCIVKIMGDGLFAIFGAPLAQEDHAFRACHASLDMLRRAQALVAPDGQAVQLRIGLNSGTVVVNTRGQGEELEIDAFGEVVNNAAHLEQRATVGTVILSKPTRILAGAAIAVRPIPESADDQPFELISTDRRLRELVLDTETNRVSFVGRRRELAFLNAAVPYPGDGRGDLISVTGEAGIGKTRLIAEHVEQLQDIGVKLVVAANRAIDRTEPNSLLRSLVLSILDLDELVPQDWDQAFRQCLAELAPELTDDADAVIWLLFATDAEGHPTEIEKRKQTALTTIKAVVQRVSQKSPLVIIVDNFQWADASSRSFLTKIAPLVDIAPILFVILGREGEEDLRNLSRQSLRLSPLSDDEAEKVLTENLASAVYTDIVREKILRHSQGNPRFLTEFVRHFATMGLRDESAGTSGNGELDVPDSISDLFAERIDQLPHDARKTLQIAAAYEERIDLGIVAAVSVQSENAATEHLQTLCQAGLMRETGFLPNVAYEFSNPVIAEAAYSSLLLSERRNLHGAICQHLQNGEHDPDQFRLIARQAFRAGWYGKAAEAFYTAGRNALSQLAYSESTDLLIAAIRADTELKQRSVETDRLAIDIRFALRDGLLAFSRFEDIERIMNEASAIAARIDDTARAQTVQRHLIGNMLAMGRLYEALPQAEDLVSKYDQSGEWAEAAEARFILAQVLASLGQYDKAFDTAQDILKTYALEDPQDHKISSVTHAMARLWAVWCAAELGRFDDVKILVMDCQSVLSGNDPPFFRILAGIATGLFWLRFGEYELAVETLKSVLPMTELDTNSAWFHPVASPLGLALVRTGRSEEALPLLQKATHRHSIHSGANHGMQFAHLAECLLSLGKRKKAEAKACEAIMNAKNTGEEGTLAYSLCVLGMVLEADSRKDEATEVFREGRSLAKQHKMAPLLEVLDGYRPEGK